MSEYKSEGKKEYQGREYDFVTQKNYNANGNKCLKCGSRCGKVSMKHIVFGRGRDGVCRQINKDDGLRKVECKQCGFEFIVDVN